MLLEITVYMAVYARVISSIHVRASFIAQFTRPIGGLYRGRGGAGNVTGKHIYTTHGFMCDCLLARDTTSSGPAGTRGWPLDTTSTVAVVRWTLVSSVCSSSREIQCVGRYQPKA